MNFISSPAYHRFAKVASILIFPLLFCLFLLVRIEDRIVVAGVVECEQQAVLASPLKETLVEKVHVESGDRVKKGQVLLSLQDLQGWRRALERKEIRHRYLGEKLKRLEKLRRQGAEAGMTVAETELEHKTLGVEIQALRENSSLLTLKAPFDGVITSRMAKRGQSVFVGTPLLALASMGRKVVECSIPESRVASLKVGQSVAIKSNMFNYLRYDVYGGKVSAFDRYGVKEKDGVTFEATIALDDESSKALKVGTTARCEIIVDRTPLYLLVLERR